MKRIINIIFFLMPAFCCQAQNFPWNNPLLITHSSDGITFGPSTIFQDSSGVPCVIRWKGDTLAAVFQWFRQPNPSPSWDRVAVKFSYDNGVNWTQPTPLVFTGMPGYQRPFDPTLVVFAGDSLRIYFSSSATMPMQLDSTVNTYSAKSIDGINYFFENNPRVDVATAPVIDPAVIYFNNAWHYAAPAGPPQAGAYHYISPNGKNFSAVPMIPSDNLHNWTGNYMVNTAGELRFYGSGQLIWFNTSPNGGQWNGYVNSNVHGGDPSALRVSANEYIMVYVGPLNLTTGLAQITSDERIELYPNPSSEFLFLKSYSTTNRKFEITDVFGRRVISGTIASAANPINIGELASGIYFLHVEHRTNPFKFVKQ